MTVAFAEGRRKSLARQARAHWVRLAVGQRDPSAMPNRIRQGMRSHGFQYAVAANSRNEPPAHPEIDKRVGALVELSEPEQVFGALGCTNEYVAKVRRQRDNVYEPWTSMLEQSIRRQADRVQRNPNLSQLRVDAFAKDAVDFSSPATLSSNYLKLRHGLTREVVRPEASSPSDAFITERAVRT